MTREKILTCLGEFPKKAPLALTLQSVAEKEDYFLHLASYNVEEGERVNSYLLVPKKMGPKAPAVLAVHQHAGQWHIGKSEPAGLMGEAMFAYGLDLVKRGYVVLAPDLLCFEERIPAPFREDPKAFERFAFCRYVSHGSCLQTKYLHDLSVAVDVLTELGQADKDNIGVIGHSLGGQQAAFLMWYDRRVKAGVCSCGVSTAKTIFARGILHNFALYVPGLLNFCDMDDIIAQIAPRAFFMTNGLWDEGLFPLEGVCQIQKKAVAAYAARHASHQFQSVIFKGGHQFLPAEKEAAYRWLDEKLGLK